MKNLIKKLKYSHVLAISWPQGPTKQYCFPPPPPHLTTPCSFVCLSSETEKKLFFVFNP